MIRLATGDLSKMIDEPSPVEEQTIEFRAGWEELNSGKV